MNFTPVNDSRKHSGQEWNWALKKKTKTKTWKVAERHAQNPDSMSKIFRSSMMCREISMNWQGVGGARFWGADQSSTQRRTPVPETQTGPQLKQEERLHSRNSTQDHGVLKLNCTARIYTYTYICVYIYICTYGKFPNYPRRPPMES